MSAVRFGPEARARAAEARRAAIEAGARFRRGFADAINWEKLAQERGIRLPAWWVAPTPATLKRWFKRLDGGRFREVFGCSPARLIELNPDWPLRAHVGVLLEAAAEKENGPRCQDTPRADEDVYKSRRDDSPDRARGAT